MIWGAALLMLLAFSSYLIDTGFFILPQSRLIWDVLFFSLSLYLLIRIRLKSRAGTFERLQKEYSELMEKSAKERDSVILVQIEEIKVRLAALEGKR